MNLLYHSNDTRTMTWRVEEQESIRVYRTVNSVRLLHKLLSARLLVVNASYSQYLQSIRTRRLTKIRKAQIREIWDNIRSRNRYRFVASTFILFWEIDRFIILICRYLSHRSKSRFSTRFSFSQLSHISFIFVFFFAFSVFAFISSRLSHLLWVLQLQSWFVTLSTLQSMNLFAMSIDRRNE